MNNSLTVLRLLLRVIGWPIRTEHFLLGLIGIVLYVSMLGVAMYHFVAPHAVDVPYDGIAVIVVNFAIVVALFLFFYFVDLYVPAKNRLANIRRGTTPAA